MKGQCLRSRSTWIDEREKPSKLFIDLETLNYRYKQILNIKKTESFVSDHFEILKETRSFYEKLYKKREIKDEFSVHEKLNKR